MDQSGADGSLFRLERCGRRIGGSCGRRCTLGTGGQRFHSVVREHMIDKDPNAVLSMVTHQFLIFMTVRAS